MNVKVMIHLTRDEVNEKIPYMLVCETTSCSAWNTRRVRTAFHEMFTEKEREDLKKLRMLAHSWALVKGIPNEGVDMSAETMSLWMRFGEFCASVR